MRTLDLSHHGYILPFSKAAAAASKAWTRRYKTQCLPLSHALSDYSDGMWTVRDAEAGDIVALVRGGAVTLSEDVVEVSGLGIFGAEQV